MASAGVEGGGTSVEMGVVTSDDTALAATPSSTSLSPPADGKKALRRPNAAQLSYETMRDKHPDVFIGSIEGRRVFMGTQEELETFNEVKEYRTKHPDQNMDEAFRLYCERKNGDAIVKVVYRSRAPDYVLKIQETEKMKGKFLPLRAAFERKLVRSGLVLVHETFYDQEDVYVLAFAPFERLMLLAEEREMNVALKLQDPETAAKPESIFQRLATLFSLSDRVTPEASASFRPSKLAEFRGADSLNECLGSDEPHVVRRYFFRKAQRQLLTWHLITHVTLGVSELNELNLPFRVTNRMSFLHLKARGAYVAFFPLHDGSTKSKQAKPNLRTQLKQQWSLSPFRRQPFDKIRDYFGERIALYFAFIGYYTWWLVLASIVGIIATIYGIGASYADGTFDSSALFDNGFSIPFAIFMSIWATTYLEFWKRRQAFLAWWWDMMHFEEQEVSRPEWYGTQVRKSPVTGKNELHYPDTVRYTKMIISFLCIFFGVVIVLASVTATIVYRVWAVNTIGQCIPVNGTDLYCSSVNNIGPIPVPSELVAACSDSCWGYTSEALCTAAAPLLSPEFPLDNNVSPYPSCEWVSTPVGYCRPACQAYPTGVSCTIGYNPVGHAPTSYLTSPGYRATCQFVDPTYASTISAAFISLAIMQIFQLMFPTLAKTLNDWENHKTDTIYEDALIAKQFFFDFLNSYTTLFYIAFFKGTLGASLFGQPRLSDRCLYGGCLTELLIQLVIVFLGTQMILKFTDVLVPYLLTLMRAELERREKVKLEKLYKEMTDKENEADEVLLNAVDPDNDMNKPPQWIKDEKLERDFDLFDDYAWLATQFGYMTLFVVAFPPAPLAGLINNVIEIRTDSYRLITRYQRPPAREAQDIGTWYSVLNMLSLMAVITNAFIVAFSSSWVSNRLGSYIPGYTPTFVTGYQALNSANAVATPLLAYRLIVVLVFEHVVFFIKILIAWAVPDVPGPVQMAIDRENYLAKVALEGKPDESPYDIPDDQVETFIDKLKNV